jgi:uncharacterized membrane protein YhaH (DUF805 family)
MRLAFDDIIIYTFGGKTGRFSYLLSLLIVIIVLCFVFEYSNPERCYGCNPVIGIPWRELITTSVMILLGGIYSCLLCCVLALDESYFDGPIIIPILFTLFYVVQTIKRCHDIGESGWRFLLPIYSPLLILFLSPEIEVDEEPERTSFVKVLWTSKWLILILILMAAYIYRENLEHIRMHNAL